MNKRQFLLSCACIAIAAIGIFELGKSIPVVAAPPLSTAVSIADPNTPTQQASVDANGHLFTGLSGTGQTNGVQASGGVSDGVTGVAGSNLQTLAWNYVWNGASWDRLRGTANAGMSVAPYGVNMVPQVSSSGNVANATATATLPAAAAKTTYAASLSCESGGATASADVDITITGALGGTMHFAFDSGTISASGNQISRTFNPPLPASAINTALVLSMPALGAGNTNATCNFTGFQL